MTAFIIRELKHLIQNNKDSELVILYYYFIIEKLKLGLVGFSKSHILSKCHILSNSDD